MQCVALVFANEVKQRKRRGQFSASNLIMENNSGSKNSNNYNTDNHTKVLNLKPISITTRMTIRVLIITTIIIKENSSNSTRNNNNHNNANSDNQSNCNIHSSSRKNANKHHHHHHHGTGGGSCFGIWAATSGACMHCRN